MRVLILHPRLDIPFKKYDEFVPPKNYDNLVPIRKHWENFYSNLLGRHVRGGDSVTMSEEPLWKFTNEYLANVEPLYDIIYIPHKQNFDFTVKSDKFRFIMQTVFPEYFTIDVNGWGANLSYLPVDMACEPKADFFEHFRLKHKLNISKFDQPPLSKTFQYSDYILFVCQVPHDETIKQFSKISVEEALLITIDFAKKHSKSVLVKGHPANPSSMTRIIEICNRHLNTKYVDDVSLYDAINNSESVFLVNSGVAFEAMLQEKRIFRFGDAEYRQVVPEFSEKVYFDKDFDFSQYVRFINCFFSKAYE